MRDIDKKIAEALKAQDAELFAATNDEQTLPEMVVDSFRTRSRWMIVMVFFMMAILFWAAVFTAIRFFSAETTREMIAYAMGFGYSIMAVGMLKMWYWMELQKNTITREIKRVELQIASLAARIGKGPANS